MLKRNQLLETFPLFQQNFRLLDEFSTLDGFWRLFSIFRFLEFSIEFLDSVHYLASRIFRPPRIASQIDHLIKFELFLQSDRFFIVLAQAPSSCFFGRISDFWVNFRFFNRISNFRLHFRVLDGFFRLIMFDFSS
jgi:hypothetical protein